MGREFNDFPALPAAAEFARAKPNEPDAEEAGTSTRNARETEAGSDNDSDINPDEFLLQPTPTDGEGGGRKRAASPDAGAGAEEESAKKVRSTPSSRAGKTG